MILVKKFPLVFFFWDKLGVDVMSDDYLVRKQVVLEYKFCILHSRHIYIFFTGVKPCVCAKLEISYYSGFERTGPTSDGHLVKKNNNKKKTTSPPRRKY